MNKGLLFTCSYDDGLIYGYELNPSDSKKDFNPQKMVSWNAQKGCRDVQWWSSRNELYVGYEGGLITVYKFKFSTDTPISTNYASRQHNLFFRS